MRRSLKEVIKILEGVEQQLRTIGDQSEHGMVEMHELKTTLHAIANRIDGADDAILKDIRDIERRLRRAFVHLRHVAEEVG